MGLGVGGWGFLTEVGDHLLLWAQLAKSLFVGGLAEEVTLEILRAAFIPFGELKDVQLPLDAAGKPRGFGFVEFEEEGTLPRRLTTWRARSYLGAPSA